MTNVICLLIAWWCSTMYLGFFFCDDSQLLPRINYWKLSVKLKNWTKHFLLVALVLDFSKNRIIINALLNVNLYDSKYFSLSLLLLMVLFYLFIQYYAVLKEISIRRVVVLEILALKMLVFPWSDASNFTKSLIYSVISWNDW